MIIIVIITIIPLSIKNNNNNNNNNNMSLYGASSIHVFKCPLQYCWLKNTRMRKNTSKLTYENACLKNKHLKFRFKSG